MNRVLTTGLLVATVALAQQAPQREERVRVFSTEISGEHGGNVMFQRTGTPGDKLSSVMSDVVMARFVFDGKTVKGAPYSAEAVTESTQVLGDGNRITHKNTSTLYRDAQGRTRREETINAVGPWSSNEPLQVISINDPVGQVSYSLDVRTKTARKMTMPSLPEGGMMTSDMHVMVGHAVAGVPGVATAGVAAAGIAGPGATFNVRVPGPEMRQDSKTEQLGKQTIEGIPCEGTRTTITIPAGQIGNERPIDVISERWYSPDLQVVVLSKNTDPRMGETIYKLSNIQRSEPIPSLFQVPSDYTVKTEEGPKIRTLMKKDKEL